MTVAQKQCPVYQRVAEEIRQEVVDGVHGDRLPTVAQLAERHGVALATMQRAIHVLKNDGVVEAAPRRGIVPTRLKRARTHVLGAVLQADQGGPLHRVLIAGFQSAAQRRGELIALSRPANHDPEVELEQVRSMVEKQKIDGVVIWPSDQPGVSPAVSYLEETGIPVVVIPEPDFETYGRFSTVSTADSGSTLDAILHLVGAGHKKIAFAMDTQLPSSTYQEHRYESYRRGLAIAGLAEYPLVCIPDPYARPADQISGPDLAVLSEVSAVLCCTDRIAAGALRACLNRGWCVPGDLAVVGYDNSELAQMMDVTSVEQHFERIGRKAVGVLLAQLEGEVESAVHVTVETELVIRGSSRYETRCSDATQVVSGSSTE